MSDDQTSERARAIRRFRWLGLYLPLAVFGAIAVVQLALLPLMPDPAATHWGLSGGPDGFAPAWIHPLMTVFIGAGISALIAGIALAEIGRPGRRVAYRLMAAVIWWEVGMLGVSFLGTVLVQVGLDDAQDAPSATGMLIAGLLVGIALGVAAWKLSIEPPVEDDESHVPAPVALSSSEQAVWLKTVTMARSGRLVLGAAVVLVLVLAAVTASLDLATSGRLSGGTWIVIGSFVLVAVLVLLGVVFRVRVDDSGLTVRAPIGWPRIHVPREEIRTAEVVSVNPMGEYGGWGWRYAAGNGWGVVMRAGEALRVTRTNGRVFTVTVEDAETGAALLGGLTQRRESA
ncbi:DUF1648 domain-containing protein [Microbacterium betulae]|uniref:DUF1648 domain-containing protein n=1 Tax=Microbacterium betulae TaxID=2981139 RepID=A0AA97FJS4_9MICO|nr:DUF1648 domain-containing protein [Microbacterium sp. AB]WOF24355.1 DUF1648 domain-containing protein [Microbacterium sp. AB]